jgi:hypothetical protein
VISTAILDISRFEGVYAFCHDGWLGVLTLNIDTEDRLEAHYDCMRFRRRFEGRGTVDPTDPKRLEVLLYRYNEAPRQIFNGYISGKRNEFIAGITWWRSVPFGFFARKSPLRSFTRYRMLSDRLTRADFLGRYTVWHDRGRATIEVMPRPRGLGAIYNDHNVGFRKIPIQVGGEHDHEVVFDLPSGNQSGQAKGYFFTRPKNGAAGVVDWGTHMSGFYMIKYSSIEM